MFLREWVKWDGDSIPGICFFTHSENTPQGLGELPSRKD